MEFGRPFDFGRPFFEQFVELRNAVPRVNLNVDNRCENSRYCNQVTMCRNCYLMFACTSDEDCYYGYRVNGSRDCADCLMTNDSELCYECVETFSSYGCRYGQKLSQCTECTYVYDCRNCTHCALSVGLRNKEYCFLNEQLTKDEYFERLAGLRLETRSGAEAAGMQYAEHLQLFPRRAATLRNVENVTGDNIENAKNCSHVFDGANLEDVAYCHFFQDARDCCDVNFGCDRCELCYEVATTGIDARHALFCIDAWPVVSSLIYSDSCSSGTSDCFGCIGLRKKQFCILNTQYTQREYESLMPKILQHLTQTGEWGEFFPAWVSPYGYNESVAIQYYPLTKEQAEGLGSRWSELPEQTSKPQSVTIADSIHEATESILSEVLACRCCAKNFKIIPQELAFYRRQAIPLPQCCSECRHADRAARRNPPQLHRRQCAGCRQEVMTTYGPERREQVLCDPCYLSRVG